MVKDLLLRAKPHIPTVIGGLLGALIVHFREVIFEAVAVVADSVPDPQPNTRSTLIVDGNLLREARENGAILVYKYDDFQDTFAIIHDPDRY